MGGRKQPIEKRFWDKVFIGKSGECWLWLGGTSKDGYGQLQVDGHTVMAHRIAYMLAKGAIPEGHEVMHNCPGGDIRQCCNPSHLLTGTHAENMADMKRKHNGVYATPKGEDAKQSKLKEIQVIEIRKLLGQGLPQRQIGKMYGVSSAVISYINTGKSWKHVA